MTQLHVQNENPIALMVHTAAWACALSAPLAALEVRWRGGPTLPAIGWCAVSGSVGCATTLLTTHIVQHRGSTVLKIVTMVRNASLVAAFALWGEEGIGAMEALGYAGVLAFLTLYIRVTARPARRAPSAELGV